MTLPARVKVVEVGPRDGLQNEPTALSVDDRIAFCRALIDAGLPVVEPGAFVSPKWVPQMAGSEDVFKALPKDRALLPMLTPNKQGYERARAAGVTAIAIFTAASDSFNRKNTNATIGVGVPSQVDKVIDAVSAHAPLSRIAVHFHDTRGTALANVLRALQLGVSIVDSSAGGLGGCPYAPGASGNLATEDLLYMLHGMSIETGVDLAKVAAASRAIGTRLGRELPSRYLKATA